MLKKEVKPGMKKKFMGAVKFSEVSTGGVGESSPTISDQVL